MVLERKFTIYFCSFLEVLVQSRTMNRSHNLSCPCYSRVTTALLYPLNKPLNHLHRQVIIQFTCICTDFCHHLQGVESCHDSSCLQVGWDFDLILTKILPWGQACTVQWGRALHGDARTSMSQGSRHLGSGHCQAELPCWRQKQLTLAHTASPSPRCLVPCLLQATPGSSLCPPLPSPFCF